MFMPRKGDVSCAPNRLFTSASTQQPRRPQPGARQSQWIQERAALFSFLRMAVLALCERFLARSQDPAPGEGRLMTASHGRALERQIEGSRDEERVGKRKTLRRCEGKNQGRRKQKRKKERKTEGVLNVSSPKHFQRRLDPAKPSQMAGGKGAE